MHSPSHGWWEITQQGREFLKSHAGAITNADLPKLQQANGVEADITGTSNGSVESNTDVTPEELIGRGYEKLQDKLTDELLETVGKLTPDRFERLVVNLLEKMGYGKGQAVGRSGDGGIDGIINQDPLGLEKVYIQAKRWSNQVGEPEIRNFSGSLDSKGATKGVFITNSTFSDTAQKTAQTISVGSKFIRLIDGQELVKLMIQHGVGVVTESTYEVKRWTKTTLPRRFNPMSDYASLIRPTPRMHKFEIILYWSNEDQAFIAEVPELSGCMAHGDSQEAALKHVNEAIQLWIDTAQEFGDPIPQPKGERLMLA